MAKGNRQYVMSGKVGNSVLYKLTDSNNREIQGERSYVAKVANPKTVGQAIQRIKMAPAINFYRAFKNEILDHSFEGIKYGGRSHARFMKNAMNLAEDFPFCLKGDNVLAPAAYRMSEGSLNGIPFNFIDGSTLQCEALSTDIDKFGEWSTSVINSFPWLKNGDQLTFAFIAGGTDIAPYPYVTRLVLNTSSTENVTSMLGKMLISVDGNLTLDLPNGAKEIYGAAIIVSRPVVSKTNGSVSWLRSTTNFAVNHENAAVNNEWFTQGAYETAVRSYMTESKSVSSEWYLNQGKLNRESSKIPAAPIPSEPIELKVIQSRNEESKLYGKWLVALRDPEDGFEKIIAGQGRLTDKFSTLYYGAYEDGHYGDNKPGDLSKVDQIWDSENDAAYAPTYTIENFVNIGLVEGDANYLRYMSWDKAKQICQENGIAAKFLDQPEPEQP